MIMVTNLITEAMTTMMATPAVDVVVMITATSLTTTIMAMPDAVTTRTATALCPLLLLAVALKNAAMVSCAT